ncbi:hypothetical protein C0J52_13779, partial [Blattella germanica]
KLDIFLLFLLWALHISCPSSASFIGEERIVQGQRATKGQFPYLVYLRGDVFSCTGSIISPRWILTAGHCVAGGLIWLKPTVWYMYGIVELNEGLFEQAEKVVLHPLYKHEKDPKGGDVEIYDIALVKTSKKMEYGEYVGEICLSSKSTMEGSCYCMGFGDVVDADEPNKYAYPMEEMHFAELAYFQIQNGSGPEYLINFMCVMFYPSTGDSGSPLVCNGQQLGVLSFGTSRMRISAMAYTSVPYFRDWIERETKLKLFGKCSKLGSGAGRHIYKHGQFPYLVHLDATYVNKDQKAFTAECTGSIISNRWILTAGHCVDTKIEPNLTLEKVMIKYGEVDVREGVYHDIEKAVIHPDYIIEGSGSDATTYYDIALVKTSKAIEYGEYVGEVCLASKMTMEGSCTSIGFGATVDALLVALGRKQERNFHLQYAPLTYVPGSQYAVRPYMIGFMAFVSYPNFGDSGGPLICEGQQLGVDSLVSPCWVFQRASIRQLIISKTGLRKRWHSTSLGNVEKQV